MTAKLLNTIKTPHDLQQLDQAQLPRLAQEIRHLIKNTVSHNGGHLH